MAAQDVDAMMDLIGEFSGATRLYALDGAAALQVERWRGAEALSGLYRWEIDTLSTDPELDLDSLLGAKLALLSRLADGGQSVRSGLVAEARALGGDGGLARYRLVLVPWLWLLSQGRHSRVFQDQSVLQIVEAVFAGYTDYAAWTVAPEVAGFLAQTRPRSYCVQYRESDLDFLQRLLAEEGLGYAFIEDAAAPAGHQLRLFADSAELAEDASSAQGGLRFHRADSTESSDAIQAIGQRERLATDRVTLLSQDYKTLRATSASVSLANAQGQRESYDPVGSYAFADAREAERAARLQVEAREAVRQTWLGRGTVRTARAGSRFELTDAPWQGQGDAGDAGDGFLWTAVRHVGVNNLPPTVMAALQRFAGGVVAAIGGATAGASSKPVGASSRAAPRANDRRDPFADFDAAHHASDLLGLPSSVSPPRPRFDPFASLDEQVHFDPAVLAQAEASGYAMAFDAVSRSQSWRPRLDDDGGHRLNPRPTAPGLQSAIVVGPQGETTGGTQGPLHTDALGRLRLRFHWQAPADRGACWVRVAQRYAGAGLGAQFLPRIGQEVLVQFVDGDIDRPLIVGALYNGQGEAGDKPTPGGASASSDASAYAQARDGMPSAQANLAGGHSPAWHGMSGDAAGHANAAALSGIKSQGFDGEGHNQLVFDDSDGQGRIQFASSQAASQLNLGHLIHQADNYRGSFRGTGFELRSDAYGAVRAQRGLLLSSYAIQSGEPAGDVTAANALLRQQSQLAAVLNQAASTHQTVSLAAQRGVEKANQSALMSDAAPLAALQTSLGATVSGDQVDQGIADASRRQGGSLPHTGDGLLGIAGRAGVGMVAGQALHWAAGETLTLGSGQDFNLAAANQLRLHSAQAIGWLAGAQKAEGSGFSLIAGQGALDVQAQHSTLGLRARDELKLISANAEAEFAAAKTIHLATSGGAHLTIENGQISIACPGQITVHAAVKRFIGPAQLRPAFPTPNDASFGGHELDFSG